MKVSVIVVAGGRGERLGGSIPKSPKYLVLLWEAMMLKNPDTQRMEMV